VHVSGHDLDRCPAVDRVEQREVVDVLFDDVRHPPDQGGPLHRGDVAPRGEGAGAGGDRGGHLVGVRVGYAGDDLLGDRAGDLERALAGGRHQFAVDQQAPVAGQ
jgi:hypothetical protein